MGQRVEDLETLIGIQLIAEDPKDCRTALINQLAERIARSSEPLAAFNHACADLGTVVARILSEQQKERANAAA